MKRLAVMLAALAFVPLLMAPTSGGLVSRPKFQSATINSIDVTPSTGTFTSTLTTGCTTQPTANVVWRKAGSVVIASIRPVGACTANLATSTLTGWPAAIQPVGQGSGFAAPIAGFVNDAGTGRTATFSVCPVSGGCAAGSVTIACSFAACSGAGAFGINAFTLVYTLD